jgi:hypothetical protein
MIVLPRSKTPPVKAPPHKAAPIKRKHEEITGSKSPAAAEATRLHLLSARPPLQLEVASSSSSNHMYQQPMTPEWPEVEIIDDSRDSDSLPGTPCTDQGAEKEVEEEVEVLWCHPQERYMPRFILAKCDVCKDTYTGPPKVCISAYTERDCNIAYKDLPKVFCKDCSDAGQSLLYIGCF